MYSMSNIVIIVWMIEWKIIFKIDYKTDYVEVSDQEDIRRWYFWSGFLGIKPNK